MTNNRAQHIRSLFPQSEQHPYSSYSSHYPSSSASYSQQQYHNYSSSPSYYSGFGDYDSHYIQQEVPQYMDPEELRYLEDEFRKKNPSTLKKLQKSMSKKQYMRLTGMIAKGALTAAALYGFPFIAGVGLGIGLLAKSRAKQIARRDAGLQPKHQWFHGIRDTDTY